jgi:DNA-binding transcriptional ArsR family regulator
MKNENLPNYYSVLMPCVRYSRSLSWFDKILFSEIVALTNVKGYCYAHNNYFEKVFNISKSTVTRSIKRLEQEKFIKTELEIDKKTRAIMYRKIYLTPMVKNDYTPMVKNDYTRARDNAFKNNNINYDYKSRNNNSKTYQKQKQKTDVNIEWINEYL